MTSKKNSKSSSWAPVLDTNNNIQAAITAKASLRWWCASGYEGHIKGDVTLERFPDTALFRLLYSGKNKDSDSVVHGVLYLPIDGGMEIKRSLLESKHASAHGIRVHFAPNCDGIKSLQLIIPTNDVATNVAGIVFGEAMEYVEAERCRFVGSSPH